MYHGTLSVDGSVALAREQIEAVFENGRGEGDIGSFGDEIGKCPICGAPVKRMRSFYGCSAYKETGCKFLMNTYICGRAITVENAKALLENGKTGLLSGFISKKSKKEFSAVLKLDKDYKIVFDFPDRTVRKTSFSILSLPCPICGKKILKGKTAYGCAGWKEGCSFRIPFEENGKALTNEEIEKKYKEAQTSGK